MIYCPNCGNACDDNANFCLNCGCSLKSGQAMNTSRDVNCRPAIDKQTFVPKEFSAKKKNSKTGFIIVLIALIILAGFIAFSMFARTRKVIDLEKCVDVSFTGYDGEGLAIMTINTSRLADEIESAAGNKADDYDADSMADYVKLSGTVKEHAVTNDSDNVEENNEELDENDLNHLSRGDIITITIDYAELQKNYKELEFSGKNMDVEVTEGLKDYKIIDPFLHLEPNFSGTAPFGEVSIEHVSDKIPPELIDIDSIYWYELNKFNNIDIGDTLVLKFTEEGKRSWKEKGLKPSREEMTYEVTEKDLSKYVTRTEEISEDDMAKMQAEARDRVISHLVSRYQQRNVEYYGSYLMVPKKENWDEYSTKSFLYLVFKTQVKDFYQSQKDIWLVVKSSDIRKLKESDKASDIYDNSESNKVFEITEFSDVREYESEEEMENNLILGKSEYERDPEFIGAE